MNKLYAIAAAMLLSVFASGSQAADVSLSMVYTNALGDELPFSIFSKHGWAPDPKARFVKLHMYFDEPIMVQSVAIDDCGSNIKPDLWLFINFDQLQLNATQMQEGEAQEVARIIDSVRQGSLLALKDFKKPVELRSLTINFEHNTNFRICGIHLKNPEGETYTIHAPELVKGTVSASSTLPPASAYDAIYLFDSRFEYGWASNKKAKNVDLTFDFDVPKRVERIRMWNGYQRSVKHCIANSRVKTLHITGDGGYDEQVKVQDTLGSQVIQLPKPFEGKHLKFTVVDSFRGKSYRDLVVSELRFYDGKRWFLLDPSAKLKQNISENRAKFKAAGVQALLNDSYMPADNGGEPAVLRLRADGSFYYSYEYSGGSFFALGNFEIKHVDQNNGLRLRLFGLRYDRDEYGDCNGCGRDCNKLAQTDENADVKDSHRIFQEFITLRPSGLVTYKLVEEGKKLLFIDGRDLVRQQ